MLAARGRGAPRAEGWGRPSLTSKSSVDRSAAWLSFLLALGPGGGAPASQQLGFPSVTSI